MSLSSTSGGRSGRRRGTPQTRESIALAAQTQFAELGYDRTTFRSIGTAAGVDPALVVHYFGSKDELFHEVMKLPPGLAGAMADLAQGPRAEIGRRLAEVIVAAFENPLTQRIIVGRIRSASQHPEAAELVRQAVAGDLARLTTALDVDQPDVRAVLAGVQVVGTALARYVVRVEPLASMPAPRLVELLAPMFQRLLVDPLPPGAVGDAG
jgi:AcrR family transcriptional regulator